MNWCPHCRKYVQTRVEKTEIQAAKWTRVSYYCIDCNGFIKTEQKFTGGEKS